MKTRETDTRRGTTRSPDPMISGTPDEEPSGIVVASRTDVGQVRSANEDSCENAQRGDGTRLLVVADGMGGHRGGATASRIAVETIIRSFENDPATNLAALLESAVASANARIFEMAQADPELEGMGTTVVALVLDPHREVTVAHVGDSRAYRYRRGHLEPLTTDHSVVAEMQRRGLISAEEAASHPRRNEILRSVGVLPDVDVEIATVRATPSDRFLLCSDGLSGVLTDEEIAEELRTRAAAGAVDSLVRIANERGGPDNISVQILALPAADAEQDSEDTAPVQLSNAGFEAIESTRRLRLHRRRLATLAFTLLALAFATFAWQLLRDASSTAQSTPESPSDSIPERVEAESQAPRKGIPRPETTE